MKKINKSVMCMIIACCFSCSSPNSYYSEGKQTLYVKMGEQPALDKVVDNLINIIGQDTVVFAHFAESNVTHFRETLSLFLCHISDGPCAYTGDTMQDIHRGMHINKNQFNHFVELFIKAMEASGIAYPIQNELLARLAPLRKQIIKI